MGWEHVIPQFVLRMKELAKNSHGFTPFPIQGNGRETRAFCFIDDFVDGLIKVIEKGGHMEIYNIGSEEEVTIKQVAGQIAKYFGKKIRIVPGKRQKGGTLKRLPDIKKIRMLGFSPKFKFRQGLQITAGWYNKNAHLKPPALII